MQIEFIKHDEALRLTYAELHDRMSDESLIDFMEDEVDPYLKARATARFIAEGDDAVGQWLPLHPATVAIRQAGPWGGAHPINVRTREMIDYILGGQPAVSGTGDGQMLTFPNPSGPAPVMDKIRTAQQGKGSPKTPPRPVVALSFTDARDIIITLDDYLLEGLF